MTTEITPFNFESHSVRVVNIDGDPWFVGKDVAEALGYKNATDAMNQHCRGVAKRYPILDSLGRTQEARIIGEADMLRLIVNSTLPAAQKFERWVFEDVLPTIRKTGSYTAPKKKARDEKPSIIQPSKEFRALYGIARLIGFDKNVAAISANQGVQKITGTNLLELMGQTHLEAERQDTRWYTPTELGQILGSTSARQVNMLLAEAGFQARLGEKWEPTDKGKPHCRILDTGKKHGSGAVITQLKWSRAVLDSIDRKAA